MGFRDWFKTKAVSPGSTAFYMDGAGGSLPQNIKAFAKEGYGENPIVFTCANIIATAAASVKTEVHTTDSKGEKKVDVAHPLLKLLAKPNPVQTWQEFAIEMVAWHRVAGEVFILRLPETGEPKELHILNPEQMKVEPGPGGVPKEFVYGSGEAKKIYPVDKLKGTSQVLHIKTFNPTSQWRGLSPLSPAARSVDIHNNGTRWNSNLLANSARPSGVLEVAGTIDETTADRLRRWFKDALQGTSNAGGVPLLTGGAKFTPLSLNPKDMDFRNMMADATKNIGLVYGVPLPILTMEAATFSNMDAAQERLWTDTVLPLLDLVIKKLSDFLMPLYAGAKATKDKIELAYNADSVPALEPKRERMFKRMKDAVAGGIITPNEARNEMGFPDIEGADELLVPGSLKPLSDVDAEPAKELVKAMKACGFTAAEIVEAIGPDYMKAA